MQMLLEGTRLSEFDYLLYLFRFLPRLWQLNQVTILCAIDPS